MVKLHKEDEHVYYWAWQEMDNPNHSYLRGDPQWYRVFRSMPNTLHDAPLTKAMSKEEAIAYCARIIKLTGGKEL